MSVLSDRDLVRYCDLTDGAPERWRVQPASVEVTLNGEDGALLGYTYPNDTALWGIIDPEDPPKMVPRAWVRTRPPTRRYYLLQPREFVLGSTDERIELPRDLCARIEGKSSLGRLGLMIHATAGFVDPGWSGRLTLEFFNAAPRPIRLWAGMRVGQVRVERLSSPAERPYGAEGLGSHYQDSSGTVQAASVAPSGTVRVSLGLDGKPDGAPIHHPV